MGAYSFGYASATGEVINMDSLMESTEIEAVYEESSIDAAARVVAETTANWNAIVEACAIDELNYLEENGVEMVYEGAKLDGFIAKAKEFFLSIWKKIQEIFKKVMVQFNSWFQTDKAFLKKYEKDLNRASNNGLGDKEVSFFDYIFYDNGAELSSAQTFKAGEFKSTNLADLLKEVDAQIGVDNNSTAEEWKAANKKFSESDTKTDFLDGVRGAFVKKEEGVSAESFVKELKEYFQGSDSKDDVKLSTVLPKCVQFLGWSDKLKTNLNKELAADKKTIDNAIKALESIKKDLNKTLGKDTGHEIEGAQHSLAVTFIDLMKSTKNILVTANGVGLNCLKSCSRQSKAVCVAALTYKAPKNEGAMLQQENTGSLLDNVIFK